LSCANGHVRADRIRSLVGVARDAGEVVALLDAWNVPRSRRIKELAA
jgi:hypothetical protein